MTYQLSNPDIETIINYCNNLKKNLTKFIIAKILISKETKRKTTIKK